MCMPERKWKNWIFQTPSLAQVMQAISVEDVVTRAHHHCIQVTRLSIIAIFFNRTLALF